MEPYSGIRNAYLGGGANDAKPDGKGGAEAGDFKVRLLRDGIQILAKQFDDLFPLMDLIGRYLKSASQVAFSNQSHGGVKWMARSASATKPSIMGVVQDLSEGPDVRPERFKDRPALVVTGNLRRSIRYLPTSKTVKLTSNAPNAELMHKGGPSTLPVTATVKTNLAAFLKANPTLRKTLGFLFRATSVSTTVPARPFLNPPESSREKIQEIAREYFERQAGQG